MLYELEAVKRVFGGRTVLDIPSLALESGLIYSLIGPNGAGKTTLLNLLAFLDTPSSGVIRFCSEQVRYVEKLLLPIRRRVVLIDQYPILFTGSVLKNLEFGLKIRKVNRKKRKNLIDQALDLVGMQNFVSSEAHKLSGGETKRVALARALIVEPEVLLCDEPTANVDAEHVEIILDILESINRERKISIVMATHSLSQAKKLAHHTLVLKNGRMSSLPQENVIPVRSWQYSGGHIICDLTDTLRISVKPNKPLDTMGKVHIYLDPERIVLVRNKPVEHHRGHILPGRILMAAQERKRISIRVDAGIQVNVSMTAAEYQKILPVIGEDVFLLLDDQAPSIV